MDFLLIYAAFSNNHYCRYTGFFPDISLIWLMDRFTCWFTRHSLTISLNGLVYIFKFGIFAWYSLFSSKIQDNFRFFPQNQDIFWFFPKSRTFSGFSPKIRIFSGFSPPKSEYFQIFPFPCLKSLHGLDNRLVNLFPTNKTIRNVIFRKFITDIRTM